MTIHVALPAVQFCAYNVTASDLTNNDELVEILPNRSNAVFTDYPTQAGALFQWSEVLTYGPLAYNPVNPITPVIWYDIPTGSFWSTLKATSESCPPGYRRPNDGSTITVALNASSTAIKTPRLGSPYMLPLQSVIILTMQILDGDSMQMDILTEETTIILL